MSARSPILAALVTAVALALTTTSLGARYLWQDEAACALLGERLLEHGAPLGWADGVLVTMDTTSAEDLAGLDARTRDADTAVRYFAERGDFKADTTWIGQPWGSLALAGASLELFGRSTVAARLPFALLGAATVLGLFLLVRRVTGRDSTALLAALLLAANVFWLLHVRQCRYYAPASALLLATLAAYLAWCDGRRRAGAVFVVCALLWFHVDFGSTVPGLAVLGVHALAAAPRGRRRALLVFGVLALLLLPGALFYELAGRHKPAEVALAARLGGLAFLANRYVLAAPVLLAAGLLAARERRSGSPAVRLVGLASAILVAEVLWMGLVAPAAFFRYVVDTAPLGALVAAWCVDRAARALPLPTGPAAAALGVALALTAWLAIPGEALLPASARVVPAAGLGLREELTDTLPRVLAGSEPDPNRAAVEFLAPRLRPGDEVLVSYEDLPLAFYLERPVRGGIPCFRVEDPSSPPRFALLRRSATFVPRAPYQRELARHRWTEHLLPAPDIPWGNNPDPRYHWTRFPGGGPRLVVLERRGD